MHVPVLAPVSTSILELRTQHAYFQIRGAKQQRLGSAVRAHVGMRHIYKTNTVMLDLQHCSTVTHLDLDLAVHIFEFALRQITALGCFEVFDSRILGSFLH